MKKYEEDDREKGIIPLGPPTGDAFGEDLLKMDREEKRIERSRKKGEASAHVWTRQPRWAENG